jgi:hypothetical protein
LSVEQSRRNQRKVEAESSDSTCTVRWNDELHRCMCH